MPNFGRVPPRSLNSFGVSGLLNEGCKVYYDNLFSTRQLGRVCDLLFALLRDSKIDELRLRLLIHFTVFEAFYSHSNTMGLREEKILTEPLVLECGIDDEKFAIGMVYRTGIGSDTDGLVERIVSGKPNGPLEELLCSIHERADRMLIRAQPGAQIEIVSLVGFTPQLIAEGKKKVAPDLYVLGGDSEVEETPAAGTYVELADVDYAKFLAEDQPGQRIQPPASGEFLAKGSTELEQAVRLRAQAAALEDKVRVGGSNPEAKADVVRIKGKREDLVDNTVFTISQEQMDADAQGDDPRLKAYAEYIRLLQGRVSDLEAAAASGTAAALIAKDPAAAEEKDGLRGMFKKVWPFKKKYEEEGVVANSGSAPDAGNVSASASVVAAGTSEPKTGNSETVATNLEVEIQNGSLDRTLSKAQQELSDIKKDISSVKAKRWVDGLVGDIVSEKARLHDMAKKVNATIRQKEYEFKAKEQQLQEEIKRRDEMLRQKNNALTRAKEQVSQLQVTMEKVKAASAEKTEDSHFKQKYNMSQKLLTAQKEENSRMSQKMEEIKAQLLSAQMALKTRPSSSSQNELSAMKMKHDRIQRQADELRAMNDQLTQRIQQLMDRVDGTAGDGKTLAEVPSKEKFEKAMRQSEELRHMNEQLTERIQQLAEKLNKKQNASDGELAKKLEGSVKQLAAAQKETDQLRLRVEEMQREDIRVKMELKRAQLELKNAKILLQNRGAGSGAAAAPGSGGGNKGTPPKAA